MGQLKPAPSKIMDVNMLAVLRLQLNFNCIKGTAHNAANTVMTENSRQTNKPFIHANLFLSIGMSCCFRL